MAINYERCYPCSLDRIRTKPTFIDLEAGESLCAEHASIVASWLLDSDGTEPLSWRLAGDE